MSYEPFTLRDVAPWHLNEPHLSRLTCRIKSDTILAISLGKKVILTEEAKVAIHLMSEEEQAEFFRLSKIIDETGRLEYPYGEKVSGEENLFAMRIRKGGNFREFYAYDDGVCVWLLNGYEKKTEQIPKREIKHAKQIKRKYGL